MPKVEHVAACALALVLTSACVRAPKAAPLPGAVATAIRLPNTSLPRGPRRVVFTWEFRDGDGFSSHGDGVARIAGPDSARLDFIVEGGFGGGWAILIGDELTVPGPEFVKRLIPPAPMLWATLGRLATTAAKDTTARVTGDTLRADIGSAPTWRSTFVSARLTRLERLDGGRIQEWVARDAEQLRYQHETGRRSLTLRVQRTEEVSGFDPSIWRR